MLERERGRDGQDGSERARHTEEQYRERRLPPTRHSRGEVRERQREEFGGVNWGSAFFGWLVAIGVGVILTALLSAAGAAIGFTEVSAGEARSNAETIGIAGGALLIGVALIAYYAGGYVAGRMSRFDGARQGTGVWAWSLIVAVVLAEHVVLGARDRAGGDPGRQPAGRDRRRQGRREISPPHRSPRRRVRGGRRRSRPGRGAPGAGARARAGALAQGERGEGS